MPNLAQTLKQEISRIARKEVREDISGLRKTVTAHRSEIASLKRTIKELGAQLRLAQKAVKRAAPAPVEQKAAGRPGRKPVFNADRLKAKRQALGMSQAQMAQLLGISSLSLWKWESGQVTPRTSMLERYFVAMNLGKREAWKVIEAS
ncbi:helix-turn-helix domain-containing protein [Hydrogenophaga crocea]|jgi:DNA-binding transcriptional regulator YiaG|uniref:Helix-turn-helix transcriptional regulator n=1 Tax=Hydrogenophaga crocea TaxID=2716225 RepID=A0A6G8IJ88_9BURK|nr:helix-turn-helix transcriptional regulator [Hydrogenophaga crocea]QIM53211.1 helix-turn-helix transcriptional regulator [Hydrogenophaga crocea]